jgi:hypothetical protein
MMTNGVYADHHEVLAIAKIYNIAITVFAGPFFSCHQNSTINDSQRFHFEAKLHLQDLHYNPIEEEIRLADWVLINCRGRKYPGKVICLTGCKYQIKVMHRFRFYWMWPKSVDAISCQTEEILRRLMPPQLADSRGHSVFPYVSELLIRR